MNPHKDKNLEIPGYNLVREDHLSNSKRGGVCLYYKSSLPFTVINVKYLQESISFELRIGGKCCRFSCLYRSPSQTEDGFETFLKNFETIICDDGDPPWINKEIKKLMLEKNLAFKSYYCSNKSMFPFKKFKALQYQLNISIEESKEKYYTKLSSRLADPLTIPKTYWSILKTFLNNKKIPCIPPLFHKNKFIADFKEKAELFNHFLVYQCSLLSNNSVLPTNLPQLTSKCLDSIHFSISDIAKIISRLDPNKAHGHDMLSIRMIKLCGNSIYKPLLIIFKDCLNEGKFPHECIKGNVVAIHKKGNKQSLENYWPISLLPICRKNFERLIFNKMFTFFTGNNLIYPNQSGFRLGDSCVNQLLAITHEIYKSFDEAFEVKGVFLDISKAFDKLWHEGLLLKLNQNVISGNLLKPLCEFLSSRKQRVVLNGQHSSWDNVTAGVPEGSILWPLLFLIYVNDLSNNLFSNCKLFADDTPLFSVVNNIHTSGTTLSQDQKAVNNCAFQWKMIVNPDLSKQVQEVIFRRKLRNCFIQLFYSIIFR